MTTETARPSRLQRASRILLSDYFVLYLSLAYVAALAPFYPVLLTPANISNVLSNMWPLLIVATGQTFVLAIAGIDLSQGAVIAVTSVVCAMLIAVTGNATVLGNAPIWGAVISEQGGCSPASPAASPSPSWRWSSSLLSSDS